MISAEEKINSDVIRRVCAGVRGRMGSHGTVIMKPDGLGLNPALHFLAVWLGQVSCLSVPQFPHL